MTHDNNATQAVPANADDWQLKVAQWAASMGATPQNSKPKLTQRERSAQHKAESEKVVYQPMTVERLRSNTEKHTRALYTAAGHSPEDVETLTSEHMATVTDDALILSWQQAGREIAAKKAEQGRQAQADLDARKAAAKVMAGYNAKLATERAQTVAERERAEHAEGQVKTLEAQVRCLFNGQRT
jgi:hypothetical protein